MSQLIYQGAEAIISRENGKLIKERIAKGYRLKEIDEQLRKKRTKAEAKIMQKLSLIIPVPKILDSSEYKIEMEFIEGKKLSEHLDSFPENEQEAICLEIGRQVARMHNENIIHADLTTSNMILSEKQGIIYFIDFGLAFHSQKIEDKAVDLHLLRQALESRHFTNWQKLFNFVLQGYCKESKEAGKILNRLKKVELRGRYKGKR